MKVSHLGMVTLVKTTSGWENRATHGIMATHVIMPHETTN
jgi:hypothetical protein